jgi:hypothetical protein
MKMIEQVMPITIHPKHGLAYCEDYGPIRAMLKHEQSLTELVDKIECDALALVADPLEKEGNRQIRENADWVKKCAKRLEKIRAEAVADLKKEPKLIEDSVRPHIKRLEAIAAQIIAPVAELDARAEALRIFADRPNIISAAPIEQLKQELKNAKEFDDSPEKWKERAREAVEVKIGVIDAIEMLLEKREKEEAEKAELAKLRAEKEQIERQTQIEQARLQGEKQAFEKMKAEKARLELSQKAKEEAVNKVKSELLEYAIAAEEVGCGIDEIISDIVDMIVDGKIKNVKFGD